MGAHRMRRALRHFSAVGLVAASAMLAGCFAPPPRNAVPPALVETARVPGFGVIRYWGDVDTPDFDTELEELYDGIKANAAAGIAPWMTKKAYFLAISGGGDNGAFTSGLMTGWTARGDRPLFEAVTGVSTGALAAPFVFLGSDSDGDLGEIYTKHTSADLFTDRGIFGLLGDSLKGTKPLEALIRGYATDAFLDRIAAQYHLGRRLIVATTNLDAQRPMIWDLSAIAASHNPGRRDLFVQVLLASSAIPGVFPPVKIPVVASDGRAYDELHVDGGVTNQLIFVPPEAQLAENEKAIFGQVRDRALYVIRNGKLTPDDAASRETILSLARRGVATLVKYQVLSDLRVLARASAASQSRFFFTAIPPGFGGKPATPFDLSYARALQQCGYQVGLKGTWSTTPADSPELQARAAAPWRGKSNPSLAAEQANDRLCHS